MINQLSFQFSWTLLYSLSNHSPDIIFAQCAQQIAYSVYALQDLNDIVCIKLLTIRLRKTVFLLISLY